MPQSSPVAHSTAFAVALLLGMTSLSAQAAENRTAETVDALLKRQSQEFSDASARGGDKAVFDRYLDERVVFMNETGAIASKKDLLESVAPKPPGITQVLVQEDFVLQRHGDTAVTAFTDVSTAQVHGVTLHARYRSTEVWLQQAHAWRMISSQTLTLQDDPPAVTLPAARLAEYVGTYRAGADFSVAIALTDGALAGSTNGGPAVPLKVELLDVLFTAGQPGLRRIFQRDAQNHITGFISRRDGHDLAFQRVS